MDMLKSLPVPVRMILVVVLLVVITKVVKGILSGVKMKNHRGQTIITLICSTVQYMTAIVGLVWVLNIGGVDVNMIFASVGLVALIVGFSAESLIEDVITGLFMIFENQFNVGDVVEIDGYRGEVEKISIRTISIRDGGDNLKIVNNSNIRNIINLSTDVSRAICDIRISYTDDLEKVEGLLNEILEESFEVHSDVFLEKPKYVGVQDLGDTAIILRVSAVVDEQNIFSGRRILNRELYLGLLKRGIRMPSRSYAAD